MVPGAFAVAVKPETVKRSCWCGDSLFPVTRADAERIDKGEVGLRCGQACWGIYLARNANKETGKL